MALSSRTESSRAIHSAGALMTGLAAPVTLVARLVPRWSQMARKRSCRGDRQGTDVDRLGGRGGWCRIETRQPEQVVDQPAQLERLVLDAPQRDLVARGVALLPAAPAMPPLR